MSADVEIISRKPSFADQFKNLDTSKPGLWPIAPKVLLLLAALIAVLLLAWFLFLSQYKEDLEAAQQKEVTLKQEYKQKIAQAVNLEALKVQKEQIQVFVQQLEKQLPSKSEMAVLLEDINQAGLGRSLAFDQFKPQSENVKEYYVELPIDIKVNGNYHDVGAFAGDVAALSRIVTLNDLKISRESKEDGNSLTMEAVAKTFRYLDDDEIEHNKNAKKK